MGLKNFEKSKPGTWKTENRSRKKMKREKKENKKKKKA